MSPAVQSTKKVVCHKEKNDCMRGTAVRGNGSTTKMTRSAAKHRGCRDGSSGMAFNSGATNNTTVCAAAARIHHATSQKHGGGSRQQQ